jgi:ribosomal protein L10
LSQFLRVFAVRLADTRKEACAPMPRPDKASAVAELTENFRSSKAAVLTEYRGLTVAQLTQLRRSLGENT